MRRSVSSIQFSIRLAVAMSRSSSHHIVNFSQSASQSVVVIAQFGEHVEWIDIFGIVIDNSLNSCDMTDGTQR